MTKMDIVSLGKLSASIRWMNAKDIPMLISVCDNDLDWKQADFKSFTKPKNNIILVASISSFPIAFCAFEKNEEDIFISALVVDKSLRRRNIGTQLIQRIKSGFLKKKVTDCKIVANERNTGLHLFLQKNNFIAVKTLRYFFDNDSGYLFKYKAEEL